MQNSNNKSSKHSNSKNSAVPEKVVTRTPRSNSAGTGVRIKQGTGSRTKK